MFRDSFPLVPGAEALPAALVELQGRNFTGVSGALGTNVCVWGGREGGRGRGGEVSERIKRAWLRRERE